jgi:prevent-host-death family protein
MAASRSLGPDAALTTRGALRGGRPVDPAIMDHGRRPWYDDAVETMAISKFKATCLATLDRVRRTGRPLRVTRFGKPVADIVPASPDPPPRNWLGALRGTLEIRGDILVPSSELTRWEARD